MSNHHAPPAQTRRRLPLLALPVMALLAILVTACSSGAASGDGVVSLTDPSATPDPAATAAASQDPEEAMLAFQACMKAHGVDVHVSTADGGPGGEVDVRVGDGPSKAGAGDAQPGTGPDMEKLRAADEACHDLLPQGGSDGSKDVMDPQLQEQLLQFAQCMRDHGIDFPDPQFDGGRVTLGGPGGGKDGATLPDPESKTFQDAQAACGSNLPGGAPFTVGSNGDAGEAKP